LRTFCPRSTGLFCVCISLLSLESCATNRTGINGDVSCSGIVPGRLAHYDRYVRQFLDPATSHPDDNLAGDIVWGTRYYMESLLDAYEATGNMKYIRAFLDTGSSVMHEVETITVTDVADPTAPGNTVDSPTITVTGWPTELGSFSQSVPIPTPEGQVALYVQNFEPNAPNGPIYFQVTPQTGGGVILAWLGATQTLEVHSVQSVSDLLALASRPLIEGQSYGRIKPTGAGLPAPGTYVVDSPISTIWHEQTGGILLPFTRFLLLARRNPRLADPQLIENWKSEVVRIAASYQNEFLADSDGALRLQNPIWLPNTVAGTHAATDYIAVEATMRMFLYELTDDPAQLAIARGLVAHQSSHHWQATSDGWFLLKSWPCMVPWSTRADAPLGTIWDAYSFDPTTPASVEEGATVVDLLHEANVLGLASRLGISPATYTENRKTLEEYLYSDPSDVASRPGGLLRGAYPSLASTPTDAPSTAAYSWSSAWYVAPEVSTPALVNANWKWMLQFNQSPQAGGGDIGYFLKAWAMSEAAESDLCTFR